MPDLLSQPLTRVLHQQPEMLQLHAWLLSMRAWQQGGFSEEAANRIIAPQAKSTLEIYYGRWRAFGNLCDKWGLDTFQASSPTIADFLLEQFKDLKRSL